MHECDQGVDAEMGVTFIEACSERAKFVTHAKQNRVRSTEYRIVVLVILNFICVGRYAVVCTKDFHSAKNPRLVMQ
jgi:hypothetical protein